MAIIGSMVAIVLHERNRVQKIESGRAKTSWLRRFVENYEKRRLDMDIVSSAEQSSQHLFIRAATAARVAYEPPTR